jgi:hypothetical protein
MLRDKAAPRFRLMPGGLISARRGAWFAVVYEVLPSE